MRPYRARIAWGVWLFVVGCGSPSSDATTSGAAPSTSAAPPAPAPSPPPTSVAPSAPEPVDAWPAPAVAMPGASPGGASHGPAFVLVTDSRPRHTVVVPVEPEVTARSTDTMLVLDGARRVVTAIDYAEPVPWIEHAPGLRPCPDGCARTCDDEMHGWARVEIDPASGAATLAGDCGPCVASEDEDEVEDESESESDDGCFQSGGEVASIVGGRAFVPLDAHDECGGYNLYSIDLATFAASSDAWAVPAWPHAFTQCDGDEHAEWNDFDAPFPEGGCARRASGTFEDCGFCSDEPSFAVVTAWNGVLHYTGAGTRGGANGGSPMWRAEVPLRPRSCPSPADPCGDPAPFEAALGETSTTRRFWVATNGSAALLIERDPARPGSGIVHVLRTGETAPSRDLPLPFAPDDVISVRFHTDVGPLVRVIDHGLDEVTAPSACTAAPAPTTATTTSPPTSSTPPAAPTCAFGERGDGATCTALPLVGDDATFEDARGGSGWGDRCVAHLRAGELDAAEAACARGLAVADRPTTRGALLYNLGRVAEARGDRASARRAYQESLEVRPGNAPTQQALDALGSL